MSVLAPLAAALTPYAAAISVAGAAVGAYGVYASAQAQASASQYNARVANRDASVAGQNRVSALDQSRVAAEDKRRENRRVLSSMRASYGASGVELAGSPLDVLTDTAYEQETDVSRIEYEGRARGREGALQMLGYSESATLSSAEARNARRAGVVGSLSYGLSGAGTVLERTA